MARMTGPRKISVVKSWLPEEANSKVCKTCGQVFTRPADLAPSYWLPRKVCSKTCGAVIPLSQRLSAAISKDAATGCWEWAGDRSRDGYGRVVIRRDGKRVQLSTHRAAYTEWVGPIPKGLLVLHSCDNPPCINPAHLRVGTHADNSADMVARGRARGNRGLGPKKCQAASDFGEQMKDQANG